MKFTFYYFLFFISTVFFVSCIQDDFVEDFVEPTLRITNPVDTIRLNSTYQFESIFLNNVGQEQEVTVTWSSSEEDIITISSDGLAQGSKLGQAYIILSYQSSSNLLQDSILVNVGERTIVTPNAIIGQIMTTSSYKLEGDFELTALGGDLNLFLSDNYTASSSLPGLYIYLSNNNNSVANALEIGMVNVFDGAHSYVIPDTGINDYAFILYFCKPFNVKVGEGILQ